MVMNLGRNQLLLIRLLSLLFLLVGLSINYSYAKKKKKDKKKKGGSGKGYAQGKTTRNPLQKKMCVPTDQTVRARHKTCLLRPDTGPCRADIVSWYYDAKNRECFRFFWGGCQGNGNRYNTLQECMDHCYLNSTMQAKHVPFFCQLAFDFGSCFGHYNRWGWDPLTKTCRRRLYSGCGGNQNNFETKYECMSTCLLVPNNTMDRFSLYTTCIPFTMADLQ